jgi:hypothetical protein
MWHICGTGEVHTQFWWEDLREREHLEDLDIGGRIILKGTLNKWDGALTGLVWLRVGAVVNVVMKLQVP